MKLNLDFSSYKGATLLKDWWKKVKEHFETVQSAVNANDAAITKEVSDRKSAVSGEAATRSGADTALGGRIDTEISERRTAVGGEATARQDADTALGQRIDGKADTVHKHKKADITDFAHKHTRSDITDFPAELPPTDASVTLDKLAPDVQSAINGATGLDELADLRREVYGRKTTTQEKSVEVSPFSLSFKCTSFSHTMGHPTGTWECTDISGICSAITVDGQPLQAHPSVSPDKITVTDDYLENDPWEITTVINLNPNDSDGYPVPGLMSFHSKEDYTASGKSYPYIKSVDSISLEIALGWLILPDDGVQAGGSELTLRVDGRTLTYDAIIDHGPNTNAELATEDKRSIVAAVNELAEKCGGAADLKKEVEGLTSRFDAHKHVKADIADFPDTMPPSEHTHTASEIADFPDTMTPTDESVTMGKLAADVKAAIDKGGSGVDSLTAQLTALKADVEYLKENVIYRFDGVE